MNLVNLEEMEMTINANRNEMASTKCSVDDACTK